jgi:hypothetical protein
MLGDFLREVAALVLVFVPLEVAIEPHTWKKLLYWTMSACTTSGLALCTEYCWRGDDQMMEVAVFAMLCAFVSGVFVAGLLSKNQKTNKQNTKSPDQLSLPMQDSSTEKPREIAAAAHR